MIVVIILLPAWTLVCFAVGCSMAKGSFSLGGLVSQKKYRDVMVDLRACQSKLMVEQEEYKAIRNELRRYQLFYNPPPHEGDYQINEEPDRKRSASLVH